MIDALVGSTWDGGPARPGEVVRVRAVGDARGLSVTVDAPFHGDPAPPGPAGRLDGLWNWEVVELFLVGADGRYLEIEVGPHGHWLALTLSAPRVVEADDHVLDATVERAGDRWRAGLAVPRDLTPWPIVRWNAFAIHGVGETRRWLAASPLGGDRPDFHRVHEFPTLAGD